MTPGEIVGLAAAAALVTLGVGNVIDGIVALSAHRAVKCPVDGTRASVRLDTRYSVLHSLVGHRHYRVAACTQWPGQRRCGQLCLDALESPGRSARASY